MKYLNLGCGHHYSNSEEWTNIDFVSTGEGVIGHNLLSGVPCEAESFDLVYHSHVLEHFSKQEGYKFISECFRVLKKGGTLRIAIPDLERIAREYLKWLEAGISNPDDANARANYEWMLLEMYDQTVRNVNGGNMGKYLFQKSILNEDFVFDRIGQEGKALRASFLAASNKPAQTIVTQKVSFLTKQKLKLRSYLLRRLNIDKAVYDIGNFRLQGEIHQWMYDRYSLKNLLESFGAGNFKVVTAFSSGVEGWERYNLDGKDGVVRKPDSLFVEVNKK